MQAAQQDDDDVFDGIQDAPQFQQGKSRKKSTNIKHYEIDIMNIINDNTFNMHNRLLSNNNRYMKVTLKSKLIGVARSLILANYCGF